MSIKCHQLHLCFSFSDLKIVYLCSQIDNIGNTALLIIIIIVIFVITIADTIIKACFITNI